MDKILTVVVPTYNEEKYLETNLNSFCIPEILPELEVLIINDGSTDASLQIAKNYQEQYPDTYRVITKENGGHGSCINTGIKEATGRYFKVVDADDWVVGDEFCELMNFLESSTSDFVSTGFLWAYDRGEADVEDFETKAEFNEPFKNVQYTAEYRFDDIADRIYIKMHNLTVKTEILKHLPLPIDEHCYYVDYEYISYPVPKVQTVTFLRNMVYRYRIGSEGQSVDIDQMIAHESDVDKVLSSMYRFYGMLGMGVFCTEPKRHYIAGIIARLAAAKYKILLCKPESDAVKHELMNFDADLKQNHPDIYKANQNKAVKTLRNSGFLLYKTAAKAARKEYKV